MLGTLVRYQTKLTDNSLRAIKKGKSRRVLPKIKEGEPSFEGFILKSQVLQTYRDILRTIYKIPDKELKRDTRDYVKSEFKSCMNVKDIDTRRSLLVGGLRQFKSVSSVMGLSYTSVKF